MTGAIVSAMMLLFVISVPIAISIGLASMIGLFGFTSLPPIVIPQQVFIALDKFPLAAIPFFILAGNLMEVGGLSRRLVDFARSFVGQIQGGLAATCVITCMLFSAISGSSVATTFAVGVVLIPAMRNLGYPFGFVAALMATSAELGVIIPPSIPMILYGVATQTSIPQLFLAGIVPGLLIAGALLVTSVIWCRVKGWGKCDGEGSLPRLTAARRAIWALLMPVLIMGGIYGGVTTPTEASVIAVFYAMVVGLLLHREMSLADLVRAFRKSVITSAVIMFIIGTASLMGYLLNREGVPDAAALWLTSTFEGPVSLMLAINAMLFVIGMFIETGASIIVLAPILQDAAARVGIAPVHFGTVMVVNLALGMITPPLGVNLFAAAQIAGCSVTQMLRPLMVFVSVIVLCLLVIAFVPAVSMTLPALIGR
ncbi:TRAP transporter large permease [Sulfitobacter pseudonitzschiae]|uniref:TRAP transporter large permease protein n=1 Tax=Pseudosulfitobacter pseudonitzschiae TaxID=1402135 RepID=A0A9Q2S0M8_9RHOB|nr:TRAP transporter large permease [Pseudosulfitobacter pseudonitzschiae]MBM2293078.1 TRAP transporter large permease [Pseudosulfitobacter pseudonitzschiae]MBM2297634.1 TRAP transporter large permease [Pseudosulfitobacter pseudonitzschiae]MBM2302548.1 TRAP transporter large permease [Pseudosulfitobacter pseudonitzschiae]MBM2312462.1 TRAP transporter large permease [Pseudosulfitobacter pseudonitzschiae]MBM2317244.1 TRAP transporter large permease [Pseudosulfitobacter pseudonitzschiae]